MPFRLSRAAIADLDLIYARGAALFGEAQADAYHAGLGATFDFLAAFPRAARLRAEVDPPIRAYPYKAHLILYDIMDEAVLIVRVRHGREDWQLTRDGE